MTYPLPPSSVPGPIRTPDAPPAVTGDSRPAPWRRVVVDRFDSRTHTLSGIAGMVYGNTKRWVDIFNANRVGVTRPDKTSGYVANPNEMLNEGSDIVVPL